MKLEDQVISLELAEKLKDLGVKQESYFYWESAQVYPKEGRKFSVHRKSEFSDGFVRGSNGFSAFTVSELGEMGDYPFGKISRNIWLRFCRIFAWSVKSHLKSSCQSARPPSPLRGLYFHFVYGFLWNR